MAASRALTYAEDTLGVHAVYDQAQVARQNLDETLTLLSTAKDRRRSINGQISDREMELLMEERGKHPDMSAAGMDKHLKVAYHADGNLRTSRAVLFSLNEEIDGLEYDVQMHETDIKIAVARMTELGGYLNYLAAVKNTTLVKPTEPENKA